MKIKDEIVKVGLCAAALLSVAVLLIVVGYVFVNGIGVISLDFLLESPYRFEYGGIFPQIIGSLCLVAVWNHFCRSPYSTLLLHYRFIST